MSLWIQVMLGIIAAVIALTLVVIMLAALGDAERNREEAEHMERLSAATEWLCHAAGINDASAGGHRAACA